LYLLIFLLMLLLSLAIAVLRLLGNTVKLPAAVQQVWPWRSALVALLAAVTFCFLVLQLLVSFTPKGGPAGVTVVTNAGVLWAVVVHFIGLVGALLDFWLEMRGPSRPMPRIDISW